ncbi:hypothetical protein J7F03_01295 [Streptomyces sp. ISL-43]|uniref:hypothetical protein n=1 Tax=Streptomyces sp. ISL-43 TaxID=2819183 RepID=UPI001BE52258|nr:hypothetical protein [Streptomyces sp. ISL-43]MBT2445743.1 hypothetical protein [Streptomyces sp. ISL-43]
MADERDRWLDKAAADRLLRGEPAAPGAEHHARARAERLRAALDALAEAPPTVAGELPGEAAAVAAFRAARGDVPQGRAVGAEAFAEGDTLVELGRPAGAGSPGHRAGPGSGPAADHASASRRARPARFALAAALASVAVGGLAAAAGAGLLDRDTHESAGRLPAVSVTTGFSPAGSGGADPKSVPRPGPTTPPRAGESRGTSPDPGNTPGAEERTTTAPGGGSTGASGAATTGPSTGGSTGGTGSTGDREGRDRFAAGGTEDAAEKESANRIRSVALCKDFRAGRLDNDSREKLVSLASGLLRIPRYCQVVLDEIPSGGTKEESPVSSGRKSPMTTLEPSRPLTDASVGSGGAR